MKTRLLGLVFAIGLLSLPVLASASPMDGTYTGGGGIDTGVFFITIDPYTAVIGADPDDWAVDYSGAYLPSADILAGGPVGSLADDGFTVSLVDPIDPTAIPNVILFQSNAEEFIGTGTLTFSNLVDGLFQDVSLWAEGTSTLFNGANITVSGDLTRATPVPAAIWLLGTGLIGLVGIKRKRGKA